MSTDLDNGTVGIGAEGVPATGAPASAGTPIDPAEYQRALQELGQYQAAFNALEPIASIVKPLLENEEERKFVEQSLGYYRQARTTNQALPPEYEALRQDFQKELAPIKAVAERAEQAQQQEYRQRLTRVQQEAQEYFRPALELDATLNNNQMVLEAYKAAAHMAVTQGLPFRDAADKVGITSLLPKHAPKPKPPTSPMSRAAEPGIPTSAQPPAYAPGEGKNVNLKEAFLSTFKRLNGKAS